MQPRNLAGWSACSIMMEPGITAIETAHPLMQGAAPAWASGWGEDAHGPFVEFTIGQATQRLRWIPPGTFQMGSPERDSKKYDSHETPQHGVRISQGFWLFDTPCTQRLWTEVMGDNRSYFNGQVQCEQRPVEMVSWDDCQKFIERCGELVPGLRLDLPTEAEWEYACRAGTTEDTYAGMLEILGELNAPVLDAIAWYGGNCGVDFDLVKGYDTSDWPEKQHEFKKGGTRVVATKDPNPWGLYDMLGNVWEWCRDGQREYKDNDEIVEDPLGPVDTTDRRVFRGGSWYNYARIVRAAFRHGYSPDNRLLYLGFRCRVQ